MAITRTPIHDDDGTGTTGTIIDNAWKQELYGQIDALALGGAAAEVLTVSAAGNITLGAGYLVHVVNLTNAGTIAITWSGGAAVDGERLILNGRGAGVTTIAHGGSVSNIATSAPTPIATSGSATYVRVAGVWMLVAHEQGASIRDPFNAANYAGSSSMIVTVTSGAETNRLYYLKGKVLTLTMDVGYFTIGGVASNAVLIKLPGGFTAANGLPSPFNYLDGNGVTGVGWQTLASTTQMQFGKDRNFTNWTLGANAIFSATASIEVN